MDLTIKDLLDLLVDDCIDCYEIWSTVKERTIKTFNDKNDLENDFDCEGDVISLCSFEFRHENNKNILVFNIE